MQLVPIKRLPTRKGYSKYKNLREYLIQFMRMNERYVRVDLEPGEAADANSAHGSFYRIIKMFDFPIRPSVINGDLYLIRADMEEDF